MQCRARARLLSWGWQVVITLRMSTPPAEKWMMGMVKWVLPLSVLLVVTVLLGSRDWIFDTLQIRITSWQLVDNPELRRRGNNASGWTQEANSYFPEEEGEAEVVRECGAYRSSYNRSYDEWLSLGTNASDVEVLCAARHAATARPMAAGGQPCVAFLFLVLDEVPLEQLWRAFLTGHKGKYSLYVHPHNADHVYSATSIFFGRKIPSRPLHRFTISEPSAVRRAIAYALLDTAAPNMWFTIQSETSIPVRPFPFTYNYLLGSNLSFVEAFYPWDWWRKQWRDKPQVRDDQMRKGELWITVHRRHAGLIVGDFHIFPKFELEWKPNAISCEIYIPTLMYIADPSGIANRSVMYVNWSTHSDHPRLFNATHINATLFRTIQEQRENVDGMYGHTHYIGHEDELSSCLYNGSLNASCWLFARKFAGRAADLRALVAVKEVLGY